MYFPGQLVLSWKQIYRTFILPFFGLFWNIKNMAAKKNKKCTLWLNKPCDLSPLNKIRCKVCACYDKLSRNLLNRNVFTSSKWCLMLLLGRSCSISFGNKLSSHTVNLCQTEHPEGRATIKFTDGKLKHLYRREFLFIVVLAEQNPSAPVL